MLNKIKTFIKNLFSKNNINTDNINCKVYIHKATAELVVVNAKGELELNIERFHLSDMDGLRIEEPNKMIFTIDRKKLEYLGDL